MKKANPETIPGEQAALLFVGDQYMFRYWAGNNLTYKFVSPASVRAAFLDEPLDSGWLDPEVRRWGIAPRGAWTVLVVPAARRALSVLWPGTDSPTEIEIPLPSLVFLAYRSLYVWAVAEAFSPSATVYRAPLPNVDQGGQVCLGNPARSAAEAMDVFWKAPFNDHLVSGKARSFPHDIRELWGRLSASQATAFPSDELVSASLTVDAAVMAILRGGR